MFHRFIVALFLLIVVSGILSASIATLDDEVTEKFEEDANLDEFSKSVNETNVSIIKDRDVTAQLTKLKTNTTDAASAANSSAKSTKENNNEKTAPNVSLDCKITTCSVKNGITTCKATTNCTSAKLKMNTTEKVTTPKAPVLDDALSKNQD